MTDSPADKANIPIDPPPILKFLGSKEYFSLIYSLLRSKRPLSVSELMEKFDATQPAMSYLLGQLYKDEYVSINRIGKNHYYQLTPKLRSEMADAFGFLAHFTDGKTIPPDFDKELAGLQKKILADPIPKNWNPPEYAITSSKKRISSAKNAVISMLLEAEDAVSPPYLQRRAGYNRQRIHQILAELVEEGMIEISGEGRKKTYSATPALRAVYPANIPPHSVLYLRPSEVSSETYHQLPEYQQRECEYTSHMPRVSRHQAVLLDGRGMAQGEIAGLIGRAKGQSAKRLVVVVADEEVSREVLADFGADCCFGHDKIEEAFAYTMEQLSNKPQLKL